MRELDANLAAPKSAHNLAKCEGPPPLAVMLMLGCSPRSGQANACREIHDFSLYTLNSSIFSGL